MILLLFIQTVIFFFLMCPRFLFKQKTNENVGYGLIPSNPFKVL